MAVTTKSKIGNVGQPVQRACDLRCVHKTHKRGEEHRFRGESAITSIREKRERKKERETGGSSPNTLITLICHRVTHCQCEEVKYNANVTCVRRASLVKNKTKQIRYKPFEPHSASTYHDFTFFFLTSDKLSWQELGLQKSPKTKNVKNTIIYLATLLPASVLLFSFLLLSGKPPLPSSLRVEESCLNYHPQVWVPDCTNCR